MGKFPPFDVPLARPRSRQMEQFEIAVCEIQRAARRLLDVHRFTGTVGHLHRTGDRRQILEDRVEQRELHVAVGEEEFERLDLLRFAEGGRKSRNGGFPAVDPVRTVLHIGRIVPVCAPDLRRRNPVVAESECGVLLRHRVARILGGSVGRIGRKRPLSRSVEITQIGGVQPFPVVEVGHVTVGFDQERVARIARVKPENPAAFIKNNGHFVTFSR